MVRINGFDVPTKSGYRSFEVWCGDITSIEPGYDVLFVSAFPGDYTPTPTSLIGALHHKLSVSVEALSKSPMLKVSGALRYWIARAPEAAPFRFLVCVERGDAGHSATLRAAFQAVSLLEMETSREGEPGIEHVVLPLLGSGDQRLEPRSVIEPLQEGAQRLLETSPTVDRIQFVEYDRNKASQLGAALNDVLDRQVLVLANDGLASPTCSAVV